MTDEENKTASLPDGGAEDGSDGVGVDEVKETEIEGGTPAEAGEDGTPEASRKKQSKATNAEFARRRREQEARAKAEKEAKETERKAYLQGQIDATKVNPYTDEPIKDQLDFEQYAIMKELDERGLDPIKGFAKALAEKERSDRAKRDEEEKAAKAKEHEEMRKAQSEVDELTKAYPGIDTSELAKDPGFQEYAENKYGRWTLKEIYEGWIEEDYKAKRQARGAKVSAMPTSTPQGASRRKSFSDMTDEEFIAYQRERFGHGI